MIEKHVWRIWQRLALFGGLACGEPFCHASHLVGHLVVKVCEFQVKLSSGPLQIRAAVLEILYAVRELADCPGGVEYAHKRCLYPFYGPVTYPQTCKNRAPPPDPPQPLRLAGGGECG